MGREIRRVPAGWRGMQKDDGGQQPHYDTTFYTAAAEWKRGLAAWKPEEHDGDEFWEYEGAPPRREYYRPAWTDEERTHFQVYETVSEGTPVTPAFATKEELARHLADIGDDWTVQRGSPRMDYETALRFVNAGWAPPMVVVPGRGVVEGAQYVGEQR